MLFLELPFTFSHIFVYIRVKQADHCLSWIISYIRFTECAKGFYGEGCTSVCSERNCYTNEICNFQTGRCVDGCHAGWEGSTCTSGEYSLVVFFKIIFDIIIIL